MDFKLQIAAGARRISRGVIRRKRLPVEFGKALINVTTRSDIRFLWPGFHRSSGDLLQVAAAYIRRGDCIWDLGSNLGIFSFCAAWKAGPPGTVFSLEPDPFYVNLQHKTITSLPAGYASIFPLCAAVANKPGILALSIPKRGQSRNHLSIVSGNDPGETELEKLVVTISADFLLDHWNPPTFVKIDVEGSELLFLQGATRLLTEIRPILYIEIADRNREIATGILSSFGYRFFTRFPNGVETEQKTCVFNTIAKPPSHTS